MKKYRNYIILAFIIAITVISCIYALKWYVVYKEERLNTTIITDYIQEIKKEEFLNYISDNPYTVIYYGVTSDENCRRFEKQFKKYLTDNDLTETIVYMNVNELVGDDFATKMDHIYNVDSLRNQNKYLEEVPAVVVYDHTTLVDFVSSKNLTIDKVEKMLNKYEFSGE